MKQADNQMDELKQENRKLRKTLRLKSPHPSRRRKEASDDEEEEVEENSEGRSDDSDESDGDRNALWFDLPSPIPRFLKPGKYSRVTWLGEIQQSTDIFLQPKPTSLQ